MKPFVSKNAISLEGRHRRALKVTSQITQNLRRMYWPRCLIPRPEAVIKILNRAKIAFVLMGSYGITGWRSEEQATQDVEILVESKDCYRAVMAVRKAYRRLVLQEHDGFTRFLEPTNGMLILNLRKAGNKFLKAVFKNTVAVGKTHRIPDLEAAVAAKYASIISSTRRLDGKYLDAGDFLDIVEHNRHDIDIVKLRRLGAMISRGEGARIVKDAQDAMAGRRVSFRFQLGLIP